MADYHVEKAKDKYLIITQGDYQIDMVNWKPLGDFYPEEGHWWRNTKWLDPSTFTIRFLKGTL